MTTAAAQNARGRIPRLVARPSVSARERKARLVLAMLSLLLIAVSFLAICVGASAISPADALSALLQSIGLSHSETASAALSIVMELRVPRVALGILVGGVLGMAGAAAQGIFRNSLAEPALIGISSGASLAVVASMVFGGVSLARGLVSATVLQPVVAFGGALVATLLVQGIALARGGTSSSMLVLAGIAINAFAGALMGLLFFIANDVQLRSATFWNLGSLGAASWKALGFVAPAIVAAMAGLMCFSRSLNALQLGESEAAHLGVRVQRTRHVLVVLIALGVGAGVSVTGVIGFVGLVVPHVVRLAIGPSHDYLLPCSALLGGALLVLADAVARTVAAPAEVPVGVITALIGAPFLLWLLLRSRREEAA